MRSSTPFVAVIRSLADHPSGFSVQLPHPHPLPRSRPRILDPGSLESVGIVGFVKCMHLVVSLLDTVSNKLETADNLANGEETNDLRSDDAGSEPLLLRGAPYAVKHVDGLCRA